MSFQSCVLINSDDGLRVKLGRLARARGAIDRDVREDYAGYWKESVPLTKGECRSIEEA